MNLHKVNTETKEHTDCQFPMWYIIFLQCTWINAHHQMLLFGSLMSVCKHCDSQMILDYILKRNCSFSVTGFVQLTITTIK